MRSFIARWNTELQQNKLAVSDMELFWSVFKPNAQRFGTDIQSRPLPSIKMSYLNRLLIP